MLLTFNYRLLRSQEKVLGSKGLPALGGSRAEPWSYVWALITFQALVNASTMASAGTAPENRT
jgi:hypothetical protein